MRCKPTGLALAMVDICAKSVRKTISTQSDRVPPSRLQVQHKHMYNALPAVISLILDVEDLRLQPGPQEIRHPRTTCRSPALFPSEAHGQHQT